MFDELCFCDNVGVCCDIIGCLCVVSCLSGRVLTSC